MVHAQVLAPGAAMHARHVVRCAFAGSARQPVQPFGSRPRPTHAKHWLTTASLADVPLPPLLGAGGARVMQFEQPQMLASGAFHRQFAQPAMSSLVSVRATGE